MESLKLETLEENEQQCGGGRDVLATPVYIEHGWWGKAFQLLSDQHMHKTAAVWLKVHTTTLFDKKDQYVWRHVTDTDAQEWTLRICILAFV